MGKHLGELYRGMRGIVTYRLSPFELKAFGGMFSTGLPNVFRRFRESFFYAGPPLILTYLVFDTVEKAHYKLGRKNPADYENDQ